MKKKEKNNVTKYRRLRYGGFSMILTALVIVAVVLLNVAFGAIESNWGLTLDATALQITDFDDRTHEVIGSLDTPVKIYTIYSHSNATQLRVQVEDVLKKYAALNSNIELGNIDPATNPDKVLAYSGTETVTDGSVVVLSADETRFKFIDRNDYYYGYTSSYTSEDYTVFDLESKLTTAVMNVTNENTPKVYFLSGHGEMTKDEYFTMMSKLLEEANYEPASLDYSADGFLPAKGDVVVLTDPQTDMSDAECADLIAWLDNGGRMLVNFSFTVDLASMPNFARVLDYYSLSYGEGYVVENISATSNWKDEIFALVPNMDEEHEITASLLESGKTAYLPYARPINTVEFPEYGHLYTKLLTSSSSAVVTQGDEVSAPSTQTVALSMQKTDFENYDNDTRIVLLGGQNLLADTYMMYYTYNPSLLMSCFDWLINQELTIDITSKYMMVNTLALPDSATAWTLAAIVVVAMPLVITIAGVGVWLRRRRL